MQSQITYFEQAGKQNTDETLELAIAAARERGLSTIVVASTTGATARRAAEMVEGTDVSLVVVPHQFGWKDEPEFDLDLVPELEEQGHTFYAATMPFHTGDFYGNEAGTAMANILRTFGQGTKVCIEIGLMAADGGHVTQDEECVLVAGTGRGADTALVATAAPTMRLGDFKVHEILCKPLPR
ncbi:MAG: pyruvate kinase alpha/beta domain-containing protein [Armatimonadota bacterium]|nr:pyruvate kinase alpha/beta domain-containing protein [Armatimonadota bacterium]